MRKLRKISGILAVAALVISFASTPSQGGSGWHGYPTQLRTIDAVGYQTLDNGGTESSLGGKTMAQLLTDFLLFIITA